MIGDAALGSSVEINDDAIVCNWAGYNPAIMIPDLKKIVYGMECWWSEIESEEDLKGITDMDINNTWYVKAMQSIHEKAPIHMEYDH